MGYKRTLSCGVALAACSATALAWTGCLPDKDERELAVRILHSAPITDLSFSPDGMALASSSEDDTVRVLDVADLHVNFELGSDTNVVPEELPVSPFVGHGYGMNAVDFSPEGTQLAAACTDIVFGDVVRVWDMATGDRVLEYDGHEFPIEAIDYGLTGGTIAGGAGYQYGKGEAFVWEESSWPDAVSLGDGAGPVRDVKFSPDGSMLATIWGDRVVRIWSTSTWETLLELEADGYVPHAVDFAPDAPQLASAGTKAGQGFSSYGGAVRIWDLEDGDEVTALDVGDHALRAIAYSPDGAFIAVSGDEPRIQVLEAWSGHTSFTLQGHTGPVNAVEFSSNGQIMASGGDDKFIRFWYVGDVVGHTCEDGIDNDGDGWFDADDPDCAEGDKETGFGPTACNDGEDNDDDGYADSEDPGCEDALDDDEEDGDVPDGGPDGGEDPDSGTDAG